MDSMRDSRQGFNDGIQRRESMQGFNGGMQCRDSMQSFNAGIQRRESRDSMQRFNERIQYRASMKVFNEGIQCRASTLNTLASFCMVCLSEFGGTPDRGHLGCTQISKAVRLSDHKDCPSWHKPTFCDRKKQGEEGGETKASSHLGH